MSGEASERLLRLQTSINEKYDRIEELGEPSSRRFVSPAIQLT